MENKPKQEYRHPRGSLFWPLLLIAAGVFLLLNTTNIIEGSPWNTLLRLWPLLLVVAGLDSIYRGEGLVGAIILIGVGTIFLLSNLGLVVIGSWLLLLRFWPVLLIAFGLDLIIGNRSTASAILAILVGLILLAAVVWFALLSPSGIRPTLRQETITQPLQGATQADVAIIASVGSLNIAGGSPQDLLLEGKLSISANEQIDSRYTLSGSKGRLRVESSGTSNYWYPTTNPAWDLQLNSQIDMDLQTKLIVGDQNLDLQALSLQSLESETIIGRTIITLPDKDLSGLDVNVTIGQLVIFVPAETGLKVDLDTGITGITIPEGFSRQDGQILSQNYREAPHKIHLSIEQPIGSLVIRSDR